MQKLLVGCLVCGALVYGGERTQTPGTPDLKALYDAHAWFALRDALTGNSAPALYRGAVAAAFGHVGEAEAALKPLIESGSDSEAEQAGDWLTYMYVRAGAYQKAAAQMEDNSPMANMLASLPDQSVGKFAASSVSCRLYQRSLFIPVSINGQAREFFVDSDANFSFMSESEARNLGLTIRESDAEVYGASGKQMKFRTAVADELSVGDMQLRNVAFVVLPDTEEILRRLPAGKQGSLGLPVLLAFRTMRFSSERGTFEIGFSSHEANDAGATICFDGVNPVVLAYFQQQELPVVLDTGAELTEIWPPFAKRFADFVNSGKASTELENGVAGQARIRAKLVAELTLCLGGFDVHVRPAHVLLEQTTPDSQWYYGRLGLDALGVARQITIDFEALTLSLE